MEGRPAIEVVIPRKHMANQALPSLSVSEAFKYTPLTTNPLHVSNVVPIPSLSTRHTQQRLVSDLERKTVASFHLNQDAQRKLHLLLKPENLAEIKFKRQAVPAAQPVNLPRLSFLAKNILEAVQVDYRYCDSVENASPIKVGVHQTGTGISSRQAPASTPLPPPCSQISVTIPQLPKTALDAYAVVGKSPKRRKLNDESRDAELAVKLRTQKEQGDSVVAQLHELLKDVFENENKIDTINGNFPVDIQHFEPPDADEDFALRLAAPCLEQLLSGLKRLVMLRRLSDVPSADLQRLQRLCLPAIVHTASLPLRFQSHDTDQVSWLTHLKKAENGSSSAIVFLYTCLATEEKDLRADDETLPLIPALLKNVFENALLPVIEARPGTQSEELFNAAAQNTVTLKKMLSTGKHLLDALVSACVDLHTARDCLSSTEFLASTLIFAQNGATEKTAVLGVQNYESVRKQAMTSLARIFAAFPEERPAILDSVLSSLDQLPSTSRSARQYKLPENKSIMLVSALFLQLVQTASLNGNKRGAPGKPAHRSNRSMTSDENGDPKMLDDDEDDNSVVRVDNEGEDKDEKAHIKSKADALFQPACNNAKDIAAYLIAKASGVSKTGDSPYRNILDLFIEDMINLLPLPEWPAAELLLRLFVNKMIDLAHAEKAVGVKNLALESLGAMGSAISKALKEARELASDMSRRTDIQDEKITSVLIRTAEKHFASGLDHQEMIATDGPMDIVSRYHQSKKSTGLLGKSARSFHLAQYAFLIAFVWQQMPVSDEDSSMKSLADYVRDQLAEVAAETDGGNEMHAVGSPEANLAYLLGVLNLGFCRRYHAIVRTLLSSVSSDQAQVRSRSLKSVVSILETDASLLDRDPTIADDVFKCAADESAMVRDASLSLIAKFIVQRPALEEQAIKRLLECTCDAKVGVQKRAIGHLVDIYAQEKRPKVRAAIAHALLRRLADLEESVQELARKSLTDIWVTPHLQLMDEPIDSAKSRVAVEALCTHVLDTLDHDVIELPPLLITYFKSLLKVARSSTNLTTLIDRLVGVLFESVISGSAKATTLLALMSFAEVRPDSVVPAQLTHLRQYLGSVSADDLPIFKSVITIFQHVLPQLSVMHQALLKDIQDDLMKSINRLARRSDLDAVMSCLRTIDGVLHNSVRFARLLISVLTQICKPEINDGMKLRLIRIAGSIGKHIDVDALKLPLQHDGYKGGPVSSYVTDVLYKHGVQSRNEALELMSLESLGAVCQSWPGQFNKSSIGSLFRSALDPTAVENQLIHKEKAQIVALKAFDELFATQAIAKGHDEESDEKDDEIQDLKKIGGSAKAQDNTSALASMSNSIKTALVRAATTAHGEMACLAVRILASLAQRGMFHPKDYAGVFVALGTSDDLDVRKVAIQAHAFAHQHHESHFEREYMHAVQQAFNYQKSVCSEPAGVLHGRARLTACFDIINSSGTKYVKKFLSNLVTRLSTDYAKLDISLPVPSHLQFVRFVAQNLAYFEYTRIDDLLHLILQLELLFSKNGAEIAQAIELNMQLERSPAPRTPNADFVGDSAHVSGMEHGGTGGMASSPDPTVLRRLSAAACAVTIISETILHLKRQYGISRDVKAYMLQQKQSKELSKAPNKVHGISGERFLAASNSVLSSLTSDHGMFQRCKEFHALMAIDEEGRISEEDDVTQKSYATGPTGEDVSLGGARGRKRKNGAGSAGSTPKKARVRPRKNAVGGGRRSGSASSHEESDAARWE